jgi:uncharacterized RDD family membrane protein YckC
VGEDGVVTAPAPYGSADPTDVVAKRFLAAVIDVGIGALISVPLFFVLSETVYSYDSVRDRITESRRLDGLGLLVFTTWLLAYNIGVFVLQRGLTGRTVGTLLTGVAVVDDQGRPLGPGKAALRSVAGIVDHLPCNCLPLVGVITILATSGHRRVGDMAARSYVVDAGRMGLPVVVPEPPGTVPMGATTAPTPMAWGSPSDATATTGTPATTGGPTPPAPPPPERSTSPAAPPIAPQPVWDPGRQAYMAWDPARQQWLQFDQRSQRWLLFDAVTGDWRAVEP